MKILILNEMTKGVTENRLYDVIRTEYSNSEGYKCDKDIAEDETFYYTDDDGNEGYDYRNIKTKECNVEGNDFEIFETDLECAKYLINKYNLNVEVRPILKEIPINKEAIKEIAKEIMNK